MDLLHVRVIAPTASTPRVEALLAADDAVTHVIVLPGVARSPAGDVVRSTSYASAPRRSSTSCAGDSAPAPRSRHRPCPITLVRRPPYASLLGVDRSSGRKSTEPARTRLRGVLASYLAPHRQLGVLPRQPILIVVSIVGPNADTRRTVPRWSTPPTVRRSSWRLMSASSRMAVTVATTWLLTCRRWSTSRAVDERPRPTASGPDALWCSLLSASPIALTSAKAHPSRVDLGNPTPPRPTRRRRRTESDTNRPISIRSSSPSRPSSSPACSRCPAACVWPTRSLATS